VAKYACTHIQRYTHTQTEKEGKMKKKTKRSRGAERRKEKRSEQGGRGKEKRDVKKTNRGWEDFSMGIEERGCRREYDLILVRLTWMFQFFITCKRTNNTMPLTI